MSHPFLSVIIPAYNEAKRIPLTLIDVDYHLAKAEFSYEIIVVDDHSTDATPTIVTKFAEMVKNLRLEKNPAERGYGNTIMAGMRAARGNWRLTMDADNAIAADEFFRILPYLGLTHGYDIIIASRAEKGSKFEPKLPLGRRLAEWVLNRFTRLTLRSPIRDFLLGFRCFSAEAAGRIFQTARIGGWGGLAEGILLGERLGYRPKEIPARIAHIRGSHFKLRYYLQIAWGAVKIRWWLSRGKYKMDS